MSFTRAFVVASSVVALASVTGCASSEEPRQKEDVDTYESELKLSSPKYLGPIANGETKTSSYHNPPRYRAYGFQAKAGDEITAEVTSLEGDGMGWITTSGYEVLAANDDASAATLDAKVVYTVPAGTPSRSYRVVFRDYDLLDASFGVKLTIKAAAATCTYDGSTYNAGTNFPASDSCNTCACSDSGSVFCTKKACLVCDPENEPWRSYIGNPMTCQTIRYVCAANMRSFQNACGCGCETLTH